MNEYVYDQGYEYGKTAIRMNIIYRLLIVFSIIIFCFFSIYTLSSQALAHPGKTDENGGHYDQSTGEYHYHHGYPAHQHSNGICPYNFDDKTDHSNHGSSSSTSSKTIKKSEEVKDEEQTIVPIKTVIWIIIGAVALIFGGVLITKRIIENRMFDLLQNERERHDKGLNELKKQNTEYDNKISELINEQKVLQQRVKESEALANNCKRIVDNMSSYPYMAQIVADIETYGLERMARQLDWGQSEQRMKKVKTIREIREETRAQIEKAKVSEYKLAYSYTLFPELYAIIEKDYDKVTAEEISFLKKKISEKKCPKV